MSSDSFEEFYVVLGLDPAAEHSDAAVQKAYKKQSLVWHPDKNKSADAAARFQALTHAKEVLLDPEAKAAFLELRRVRQQAAAHEAALSGEARERAAKRQRMREDLDRAERATAHRASELRSAQARLRAQLEKLRQRAMERAHAEARGRAAAMAGMAAQTPSQRPAQRSTPSGGGQGASAAKRLEHALKVTWQRSARQHSEASLRSLFEPIGDVTDVFLTSKDGKRKGSAVIVMADAAGAARAADSALGLPDAPLLIRPVAKVANVQALGDNPAAAASAAKSVAAAQALAARGSQLPRTTAPAPMPPGASRLFPVGAHAPRAADAGECIGAPSPRLTEPIQPSSFPSSFPAAQSAALQSERPGNGAAAAAAPAGVAPGHDAGVATPHAAGARPAVSPLAALAAEHRHKERLQQQRRAELLAQIEAEDEEGD